MSKTTQTTEDAVKAASDVALMSNKVAQELKARLDRVTPAAEVIKAAAEALIDTRWVDTTDVEKVAAAISNPTFALQLLEQLSRKSAEKLASLQKQNNPRLDAGELLGPAKRAADMTPPVDVASQQWHEKLASYRQQQLI